MSTTFARLLGIWVVALPIVASPIVASCERRREPTSHREVRRLDEPAETPPIEVRSEPETSAIDAPIGRVGTSTLDSDRTHFRPEDTLLGEMVGPFGFDPPTDHYVPWITSARTTLHLCPASLLVGGEVLRAACPVVGALAKGTEVWGAEVFPSGDTAVLVLEDELVFFDPNAGREVRRAPFPGRGAGRHRGTWTFTPGGRLLIEWGSGTCVSDSELFDSRGRRLTCAGSGTIAPDRHHLLDLSTEPLCGREGGRVRLVDLDTCRESATFELTPAEAQGNLEPTFDAAGVSVHLEGSRTIRIPYPSRSL